MRVLVLAVPLVLILLLAGLAVLFTTAARRPAPPPSRAAEAARGHALIVNITAWVLALLVPGVIIPLVGAMLFAQTAGAGLFAGVMTGVWPAVHGLVFLAVHAVGELTWPRPSGTIRRAALTPRQATDVVPTWLHRVSWAWALALAVTLAITGVTATGGRTVSVTRLVDGWGSGSTASPYPGWFYGLPLLVGTGLILAAGEGVLRLIRRRPAVVDADPTYDAASRRLSAHRTLRGVQLVLGLTLAGVLVVAGRALMSVDVGVVGAVVLALGLLVAAAGIGVAIVPGQPPVAAAGSEPQLAAAGLPGGGDPGTR